MIRDFFAVLGLFLGGFAFALVVAGLIHAMGNRRTDLERDSLNRLRHPPRRHLNDNVNRWEW